MTIKPRRLERGARIALVAPAGPITQEGLDRAVERVRGFGWEPIIGQHAICRRGYLAGTDAERLADLNAALKAGENDAIWCLRGGYGTMRILEQVDLAELVKDPRPLIGFSDNTALHLAARRTGLVTFHGPHAAAADLPPFALEGLLQRVTESVPARVLSLPSVDFPHPKTITPGIAEGRLTGGNLSLLAATAGTRYQARSEGAILILEEIGEPGYRLDRLMTQLLMAGMFDGLAGIVVGAITECSDNPEYPFELLRDRLGSLGMPVACGFPFGHVAETWTLPLGIRARLNADDGTVELLEAATAN